MSYKFKKGWYVLYVKYRYEKKIDKVLKQQLFKTYLPLVKKIKKWSDRKKIIYEPIFPSYIFVYINNSKEFSTALLTDGACSFIQFGKDFALVREEEINNMKILLEGGLNNIDVTETIPKVGEIKKIQDGLLCGLECEIVQVDNIDKIIVSIDSIHVSMTATLPLKCFQNKVIV